MNTSDPDPSGGSSAAECVETFLSHAPEDTHRLAARLLKRLSPDAVLALHGDLGSGKTTFVQGLAAALGVTQPVTSPTFTLIHEYPGAPTLYHVDLYRIRSADEALRMGLEEYLHADGLTVIEWAERAAELLPDDTLHVRFEPLEAPDDRRITLRHRGPPLLAVSRPDGRAAPAGAPG